MPDIGKGSSIGRGHRPGFFAGQPGAGAHAARAFSPAVLWRPLLDESGTLAAAGSRGFRSWRRQTDLRSDPSLASAEILSLADLNAFVKFAGSDTTLLTEIPVYKGPKTGGWQLEAEEEDMKTDMTYPEIKDETELNKLANDVARLGVGQHTQAHIERTIGLDAAERVGRNWLQIRPRLNARGLEIGFTPGEAGPHYELKVTELRSA